MKLAKFFLSLFSFGAAIVAISMSWATDLATCMAHARGYSATYSFAKNCGYIYLALKASLTRFPINHITMFEKIVIGSLFCAFPLAGMATFMAKGELYEGICVPIQKLEPLILAVLIDAFWNFSCLALFNIPLALHAKSIKKGNDNLKKMLQRNLLGCVAAVLSANFSLGLMIYSTIFPIPFTYGVTLALNIELVIIQFVAWQQTQKKHPNEASTADKQSKLSELTTAGDRLENAEEKSKKKLEQKYQQQPAVITASQSLLTPLVPIEVVYVQQQSSEDMLSISGSHNPSEPMTPLSEISPSRHSHNALSSSLTSKEDEPKILAHRISEMDESEDALVVKPNPLFQGHLGA